MGTPFKLKSGNASAFKNLGSSPAKQTPENWNAKGSSGTGPKIESKVDASRSSKVKTQNFRNEANKIKTVSSQTNKGSKVIEILKKGKNKVEKVLKHPTFKKIIKVGGKFGGALLNVAPAPLVNPTGEENFKEQIG